MCSEVIICVDAHDDNVLCDIYPEYNALKDSGFFQSFIFVFLVIGCLQSFWYFDFMQFLHTLYLCNLDSKT